MLAERAAKSIRAGRVSDPDGLRRGDRARVRKRPGTIDNYAGMAASLWDAYQGAVGQVRTFHKWADMVPCFYAVLEFDYLPDHWVPVDCLEKERRA